MYAYLFVRSIPKNRKGEKIKLSDVTLQNAVISAKLNPTYAAPIAKQFPEKAADIAEVTGLFVEISEAVPEKADEIAMRVPNSEEMVLREVGRVFSRAFKETRGHVGGFTKLVRAKSAEWLEVALAKIDELGEDQPPSEVVKMAVASPHRAVAIAVACPSQSPAIAKALPDKARAILEAVPAYAVEILDAVPEARQAFVFDDEPAEEPATGSEQEE